ncbi:MAG TPA: right-handed parallel beta-helix repeat-containing protein [Candidatus Binatia bacterium]|nr:right-handed parallel beta-helix repeat-containing protein [Candidatus Binatia bacterium]
MRYGVMVMLLLFAMPDVASAQAWAPPIGIPHPGAWFLKTEGNVQLVTAGGTSRTFTGTGTANAPIIFRGVNNPRFTGSVTISGSYVIVENIDADGGGVNLTGEHVALRSSEVRNANKGTMVQISGTDVVVYGNRIHGNGDADSSSEADRHGVGGGGNRIWIVDNEIYRNGGDSVQFGHNGGNRFGTIYIGRNVMHHDRENAVDIKEVSNVVISQNTMYGYRATSSSEGAAVVLHYCPVNAQVIFNTIYDSSVGISASSLNSSCNSYRPVKIGVIGNVIWNVGTGIQGWGSGKVAAIVGNTIYGTGGAGINVANLGTGSVVENNILWSIQGRPTAFSGGTPALRNNLLDTANPQFVNPDAGDFHLRSTSPAIGAGVASAAYATYQSLYGVPISVDRDGVPRPSGGTWDIGAYEFVSGGTPSGPPAAPTGLTVR